MPRHTESAPAKVNLTLGILGQRADGYHLLDSLVVFASACDGLSAQPAETLSLTIGGRFGRGLSAGPDNLVLRAARALAEACAIDTGAAIHLDKQLPIASGIGGGSSDAAATLRLLSALWGVDPPSAVLHAIASSLGADVPVCLTPQPRRMGGIGDVLTEAPRLPVFGMALVNPGTALATGAVFRGRSGPFSPAARLPGSWPDAARMAADLAALTNDLEPAGIALCPAIADVLAALRHIPGCLLARMSGSGATCFALFATPAEAASAAVSLARPGCWCWGGALLPGHAPLYADTAPLL